LEKAKVFLIEADEGIMEMATKVLKFKGHQVVLTASNHSQSLRAYQLIPSRKVNVAVIDSSQEYSQEIAERLRSINPGIKIVAFGWGPPPKWSDAWVDKYTNPGDLGKVVIQL